MFTASFHYRLQRLALSGPAGFVCRPDHVSATIMMHFLLLVERYFNI